MNTTLEKIYERILQHIILIALCVVFVLLSTLITVTIVSVLPDFLNKDLIRLLGGAIGLITSFVLLHYIFRLSKEYLALKTIIYLSSVVIASLIFKYTIYNFYLIPYAIRIIFPFLIPTLSYELSSLIYKLLSKTPLLTRKRRME